MEFRDIRVSQISQVDRVFGDLGMNQFGERRHDESSVESELKRTESVTKDLATVIVREVDSGRPEFELLYGHRALEGLSQDTTIHAAVYGELELTDQECCRVVLLCDLSLEQGLLTQYERAKILAQWNVEPSDAARLLGVSTQAISNWKAGAEQYDRLQPMEIPPSVTFYHLVKLARHVKKHASCLDEQKSLVESCSEKDLSVRQFVSYLSKQVEPGEKPPTKTPPPPTGMDDIDGEEEADDPHAEENELLRGHLADCGFDGRVTVSVVGEELLEVTTVSPLALSDLAAFAECLIVTPALLSPNPGSQEELKEAGQ